MNTFEKEPKEDRGWGENKTNAEIMRITIILAVLAGVFIFGIIKLLQSVNIL